MHPLELRAVEFVKRPFCCQGQERQRLLGRPSEQLGSSGIQCPPCSLSGVDGEIGGTLEECRGGRDSAPRLRPPSRTLQLVGDFLIGRDGRTGKMPRPAVGIGLSVSGRSQGSMRVSPSLRRRGPIDRGTQQWVAEGDSRAELEHAIADGGVRRIGGEPELRRRPPKQCRLTRRLGGGKQQESLRGIGQLLHAAPEACLDPGLERRLPWQAEAARQLGG